MAFPTKKGQKFKHLGVTIYTVKSFFGSSGIEYDTFSEAWQKNPSDKKKGCLFIKNVEYGGASKHNECVII